MVNEVNVGDVVRLKKKHPCGSYEWKVTRVGVDMGVVCLKCGRHVLLPRHLFEKRLREVVSGEESLPR